MHTNVKEIVTGLKIHNLSITILIDILLLNSRKDEILIILKMTFRTFRNYYYTIIK
jgi:hypothetical protein